MGIGPERNRATARSNHGTPPAPAKSGAAAAASTRDDAEGALNTADSSITQAPDAAEAAALDEPELVCQLCQSGDHGDRMLLCDSCDHGYDARNASPRHLMAAAALTGGADMRAGPLARDCVPRRCASYHMDCLTPPVIAVPKGKWLCPACLPPPEHDLGFEEGHRHTLRSFQEMADRFKQTWFRKVRSAPCARTRAYRPQREPSHARAPVAVRLAWGCGAAGNAGRCASVRGYGCRGSSSMPMAQTMPTAPHWRRRKTRWSASFGGS